jgi:hypothetical protein
MTYEQQMRIVFSLCESLKDVAYLWRATQGEADFGRVMFRLLTGRRPLFNKDTPVSILRNAFFARALRKNNLALFNELIKEGIIRII